MYVAMTRARKNLAISFYGTPSRFLEEIPEECFVLQNNAIDSMDTSCDDGDNDYEKEDYITID